MLSFTRDVYRGLGVYFILLRLKKRAWLNLVHSNRHSHILQKKTKLLSFPVIDLCTHEIHQSCKTHTFFTPLKSLHPWLLSPATRNLPRQRLLFDTSYMTEAPWNILIRSIASFSHTHWARSVFVSRWVKLIHPDWTSYSLFFTNDTSAQNAPVVTTAYWNQFIFISLFMLLKIIFLQSSKNSHSLSCSEFPN